MHDLNTTTHANQVGGRNTWRKVVARVPRWIEHALAGVGLVAIVFLAGFNVSVVTSPSMQPTLQGTSVDDGDRVLTEKLSFRFRRPRRWEVIAFVRDDGVQVMKRVAGFPGEHVQLSTDGRLLIDGQAATIPPALNQKFLRFGNLFAHEPVPCGKGYYVLGDDSKDSDDSRFNGTVAPDRIVGRAVLIVWPPSRFGVIP